MRPPPSFQVRMDSHMYPDYLVPPNYDSLLGKLIVWGQDRTQAIARMQVRLPGVGGRATMGDWGT